MSMHTALLEKMFIFTKVYVLMVTFGWLEEPTCTKAEWNSATEKYGELFAMTSGAHLMLKWSADSWALTPLERKPSTLPSLDKELDPSGLMMWSALERRLGSYLVVTPLLALTTASTLKMLVSDAHHLLVMIVNFVKLLHIYVPFCIDLYYNDCLLCYSALHVW